MIEENLEDQPLLSESIVTRLEPDDHAFVLEKARGKLIKPSQMVRIWIRRLRERPELLQALESEQYVTPESEGKMSGRSRRGAARGMILKFKPEHPASKIARAILMTLALGASLALASTNPEVHDVVDDWIDGTIVGLT